MTTDEPSVSFVVPSVLLFAGIYLGGDVGAGAEGDYKSHYEIVPHGLLKRLVPKRQYDSDKDSFVRWLDSSRKAWATIHDALAKLPPVVKYDEETWEWTVGKDYWDHRASDATYKLDMVTDPSRCGAVCQPGSEEKMLDLLVECANDLESFMDEDPVGPSPNIVKNAGIAYSKMIQGKFPEKAKAKFAGSGYPFLPKTRQKMHEAGKFGDWSEHASYRTMHLWRRFLNMKGSKQDPSYDGVKRIVEYLESTDRGETTPSEGAAAVATAPPPPKAEKKKKKRKKKKKKKKKGEEGEEEGKK